MSLVIILSIVSFLGLVFWLICWTTHREMVIGHTEAYGYASFKKFHEEFLKIEWERKCGFRKSYFNYREKSKVHASIIEFNGKGMILYPLSFLRFCLFCNSEKLSKKTINWN